MGCVPSQMQEMQRCHACRGGKAHLPLFLPPSQCLSSVLQCVYVSYILSKERLLSIPAIYSTVFRNIACLWLMLQIEQQSTFPSLLFCSLPIFFSPHLFSLLVFLLYQLHSDNDVFCYIINNEMSKITNARMNDD